MKPEYQEYKGHRIELRPAQNTADAVRGSQPELRIDGETMRYGRLPDGKYFLYEYAYDPRDDLQDLAHVFIDARMRSEDLQSQRARGQEK